MSQKANVSEGFLSQVENNVSSPSVDTLVGISNAIGVNAGDLLNQIENQERLILIRREEWIDVDLPDTGFATRRFFPPESRSIIDSAILVLEPGKTIPVRKGIKNGQEILCILKGSLELIHQGKKTTLSEGDTVHFWSDVQKQSIFTSDENTVVVLWVGTL